MGKKEFEEWLERHPEQKATREKWKKDPEGRDKLVKSLREKQEKILQKELEDNKEEVERYKKVCEERKKKHQERTGSEASTSS